MSQNFLGKLNTLYSKRADKIISFYMKMTIFGIILRNILIKMYTNTHQIASFFKNFSEDLLNPVMYAHLSLFEKKTIQKGPLFPIFKMSSSIHKNSSALIASIVLKKIYSHVFVRFLKKQFHAFFCIRSKSQILRVKNVKKTNLTHPKAAKLATLPSRLSNHAHIFVFNKTELYN